MAVSGGSSRGAVKGEQGRSRASCRHPSGVHTQPCSLADALRPAVSAAALSMHSVPLLLPHTNAHPAAGSVAVQAGAALKLHSPEYLFQAAAAKQEMVHTMPLPA